MSTSIYLHHVYAMKLKVAYTLSINYSLRFLQHSMARINRGHAKDSVESRDIYKNSSWFRSIALASSVSTPTSDSALALELFLPQGTCIVRISTDSSLDKRGILEKADILWLAPDDEGRCLLRALIFLADAMLRRLFDRFSSIVVSFEQQISRFIIGSHGRSFRGSLI